MATMKIICGRTGDEDDLYDDAEQEDERVFYDITEDNEGGRPFYWTQALQQSFREELEKYVLFALKVSPRLIKIPPDSSS
jgi:phosphatidylinositol 4-kinase type 2